MEKTRRTSPQRQRRPSGETARRQRAPARNPAPSQSRPPRAADSRPRQSPLPKKAPPPRKAPPKRRRRPPVNAAERRRRRRRRMAIFYLLLFLVVLGSALTLSLTVLFRVETIEVKGESRYSAEEILEASGLEAGGNLFLTDVSAASAAIEKTLPYIGEADVRRVLPSEIEIEVSEEELAGAVLDDTQYILVGVSGKVLDRTAEKPENCPLVKGLTVLEAQIGSQIVYEEGENRKVFESLSAAVAECGLDKVTELDVTDAYDSTLLYNNRILLEFGAPTALVEKISFFQTILERGDLTDQDAGTFNLTVYDSTKRGFFEESLAASSAPEPSEPSEPSEPADPASSAAAAE